MFLSPTAIRGAICMLSAWAELPWEKVAKRNNLYWNRVRCGLYVVTLSVAAPLNLTLPQKAWFWWYMLAPTARALGLLGAQIEISGAPSWMLLLTTAGTLVAVDPPFGHLRDAHHRVIAIIYAWGVVGGIHGRGGNRTLRWMLTALASLEVLYFTGGWDWGLWWLFPLAQTATKFGAWLYVRRAQEL